MVIGSTAFNYKELYKHLTDPDAVVRQAVNMVPIWLQFRNDIVNNQRYYVATLIRGCLTIPYKTRKSLMDALLDGISISGVVTSFTAFDDILKNVNKEELIHLLEEDT